MRLGRMVMSGAWLCLGLLIVLGALGCGGRAGEETLVPGGEEGSPAPRMEEGREPCAGAGECEPRDVSVFDISRSDLFSDGEGSVAYVNDEPAPTVEEILEKGLRLMGASPVQVVLRGTATEGSVRCEWRGVARTLGQREAAIRFWLELDEDDDLPSASVVESRFMAVLDVPGVAFPELAKANFRALAQGGLTTDYQFLSCYADVGVHEYLVGSGQTNITVAYDQMADGAPRDAA